MGTLAHLGSAPCNHGHDVAVAIHVCVSVCVRVCTRACRRTRWARVEGWVCVLLAHVCDAVFRESNLLQGVGEEWRKRNGGESRVANLHRTARPSCRQPLPPLRSREGLRVPAPHGRLGRGVLSHGEPCRAGRAGAPPFPAGSTPAPSPPRGLCTRVVGLHGCGKRGKGGFGGHVRL